jgi:ribonuclease-3
VLDMVGPDHERVFRVEVWVEGEVLGAGEGPSRRVAETAAASEALDRLRMTKRGGTAVAARPDGE